MSISLQDMALDVSAVPRPARTRARAAARNPALHATTAESLVVVVAPANGRFQPSPTHGGVHAGEVLGHLTVGQGRRVEVPSPADLRIEGLLIRPGQLAMAGQALLWGRLLESVSV